MLNTLIVEDNATFRQSLKEVLCDHFPSLVVEEAGDGKEALEKIDKFVPHLVFVDIKLPGASGLEITGKIKALHFEVIVIILTSYDLPEYRQAAEQYGADYFLSKGATSPKEIVALVGDIATQIGFDLNSPNRQPPWKRHKP